MTPPKLPTSLSLPHGGKVVGLRLVGEGASSWVLRGELDGRAVGVKIARESAFGFEREAIARAVAGVGAPIDAALVEGKPALVFEWIEGEKLSAASAGAEGVAHDLGAILARLHLLGFRHGDVKSDNVVVRHGRASLIDFGLAAPFAEPLVGGTPAALPPEVLASGDAAFRVGPEADVYALGLVLQELGAREPLARLSLSPSPGERPSAAMLAGWDSVVPVDAAYLLARLPEIEQGAREGKSPPRGTARGFVEGVMRALAALAGRRADGAPLPPLDDDTRRKLLVRVVGRAAEGWRLSHVDDDALVAALQKPALILRDLVASTAEGRHDALARLVAHPGDEGALATIATADPRSIDDATASALLTVLRRAGRFVEAQAIAAAHPALVVEACELARASGDRTTAEKLASSLGDGPREKAARARLAIDRGDLDAAAAILADAPALDAHVAEARAILAWRKGAVDEGLAALDAAKADDPELVARATLVRGLLLHARGDSSGAMRAFSRAADVALAIAAVPLEATARAGAAAAAHDVGRYGDALDSASRAIALLSRLGRHGDVARARLNRAATLVGLGANAEALAEGARAQADASRAGDDRAIAYALFVQSEATLGTQESLVFARAGREKLGASNDADSLLGLAHEVLAGGDLDPRGDRLVLAVDATLARWTWWRAALTRGLDSPLDALMRASDSEAAPELVGATLAAAIDVARRTGRGDAARALSERIGRLAVRLAEDVPHGRRAAFAALPWVRAASEGRADELGLGAGQIDLLSSIARGLRDRTSLGDLLRQVLDGLVLWVGVERGLLLLRAPGEEGRLVPRVARGLSREDLRGDQLALSTSLAKRALATLEPVVAVDAGAGDAVTASIHALRLRSVLAVPLVARGEALGVVYLDDRVRRGAFGPREVAWVRLLATQAAAAIADARDSLRLRRLARRAERAQRSLEDHLSKTEGALEVARAELAQRGKTGKGDPRGTKHRYDAILGDSEAIRRTLALVDRVTDASDARIPLLVVGESG
ncbi:MAG: GAF domain-containing protein, partial [Polyangiales bacterium]